MTRGKKMRAILILIVLVGAVILILSRQSGNLTGASANPQVGRISPDFTATDLKGNSVTLSKLQGKPVILNFWASWCPPCQAETPDLVKLSQKYGDRINFYGINLTSKDTVSDVQAFVKDKGIPYPVLLDKDGKIGDLYQIDAIPTTFVLDSHGKIIDRKTKGLSADEMEALIHEVVQ